MDSLRTFVFNSKASTDKRKLEGVITWSRALGFDTKIKAATEEGLPELNITNPESVTVPSVALKHIYRYCQSKKVEPMMFILRDLSEDIKQNPDVQRWIRECFWKLRETKCVLVLIQPALEIPSNLEKEIAIMDFATPDTAKYRSFFNKYIKSKQNVENKLSEKQVDQLCKSMSGLTTFEAQHILPEITEKYKVIDSRAIPYAVSKKKENLRKGKLLEYIDDNTSLEDIGGLDLLKEYLEECADSVSAEAIKFGIRTPRGFLSFGPPGVGKTAIAKAAANILGWPLIRWDIGQMFGQFVGQSEQRTRLVIKMLEQYAPAVVLLDELDKFLSGMKGGGGDSGVGSRVFGSILTFMSDTKAPLFFVGTANSINLPPEVLRKGRWDELFYVPLPDKTERRQIFKIHLRKVNREPKDYKTLTLAKNTDKFSGAEIASVVQAGLKKAFHEKAEDLTMAHLLAAIAETKPIATTMSEEINAIHDFASTRARAASSGTNLATSKTVINDNDSDDSGYFSSSDEVSDDDEETVITDDDIEDK